MRVNFCPFISDSYRVLTRSSGLPFNGIFLIVNHLEFPNFGRLKFFENPAY